MADTTPRLGYPLIGVGNIQGYVSADGATQRNDALVQPTVKSRALTAPPGSPAEGDQYIVALSPTGAWTGHATHIAQYFGATWAFYVPQEGWLYYDQNANEYVSFDGLAWNTFAGGGGGGGGGGSATYIIGTGPAPTTAELPNQGITFRYSPGGAVTLHVNDNGVIKSSVLTEPA